MTYNIHHGGGYTDSEADRLPAMLSSGEDPGVDLDRIARVILAESPDVVCLQEVDRFWGRSGHVDQPAALAELLGMEVVFAANLVEQGAEYGAATFTRFPILRTERVELSVEVGWEPRGLLDTRIDVPEFGEIAVLNTHLQSDRPSYAGSGAAQREAQAGEIVAYMSTIDVPVVLAGDFNAERGSAELQPIVDAGLLDGLEDVEDADRLSYPCGPRRRVKIGIDHVFASSRLAGEDARVVRALDVTMASDHYPVTASFRLAQP